MIKRCMIKKYDASITEPPYKFIIVKENVEVDVPQKDEDKHGEIQAYRLRCACASIGHTMRFFSSSEHPDYDYDVVVKGEMEYTEKYLAEGQREEDMWQRFVTEVLDK